MTLNDITINKKELDHLVAYLDKIETFDSFDKRSSVLVFHIEDQFIAFESPGSAWSFIDFKHSPSQVRSSSVLDPVTYGSFRIWVDRQSLPF